MTNSTTRTRRPRPKLVEILEEKGEGYLRVGVKNGGCAGMEYLMDYVAEPEKFDEVVEDKGVQIVVDAKAVLFLLGSVVDYEVDILSSKFTFKNPNQTDACGCGESVTIVPFLDA